jgi:hypothetical protein
LAALLNVNNSCTSEGGLLRKRLLRKTACSCLGNPATYCGVKGFISLESRALHASNPSFKKSKQSVP